MFTASPKENPVYAMSSKGDGVVYAIAVVGSCIGEAKT